MAIERTVYFANCNAYNILDTRMWMDELQSRLGQSFPELRYESIYAYLSDMVFNRHVDGHLPDVSTGIMLPLDIWFLRWGIRCSTHTHIDGDDASVGTFSVDDSSFCLSDNSVIDEDLEFGDDDSTITLLSINLSDPGDRDWCIDTDSDIE